MYFIFKRIADILASLIMLLLLLPLFMPVILVLAFTGEHEIFYRQERMGKNLKPFMIWKFATMMKNSFELGGEITLRNDWRVTPIGHYLRLTKINELPQLLNVLMGEMSFVGPRPLLKVSLDSYTENERNEIYQSVPGLTGIGSIIFRDEEKLLTQSIIPPKEMYESHIMPHKAAVELWYQRHKSFRVDFLILLVTAYVIFFPSSTLIYTLFTDLPKRNF